MDEIKIAKMYSLGEAALLLRISESTLRRRIRAKKIQYFFDGVYKFQGQWVIDYLAKHTTKAE